ncbi:MAG: hypothetical protein WC497_06210 [Patescibacteria group bacterium]
MKTIALVNNKAGVGVATMEGVLMKISLLVFCFFLVAFTAHAAVGDRHVEQAGGFSLQAPRGWMFRDFPGLKYQAAVGPAANLFSPNINVVDEVYDGDLKSYVDQNAKNTEKVFVQYTLIKRSSFVTLKGIKGEKMVTTSLMLKNMVRQIFYFFPGSHGKYFVITCTALAEGGDSLDSIFDESMRSFEIIPTTPIQRGVRGAAIGLVFGFIGCTIALLLFFVRTLWKKKGSTPSCLRASEAAVSPTEKQRREDVQRWLRAQEAIDGGKLKGKLPVKPCELSCPKCGATYTPADYIADAPTWLCSNCKSTLQKT